MTEQVEGSFTFTVLDEENSLWFVKGDSPLCLYHYPQTGLYLYASTQAILEGALKALRLDLEKPTHVELLSGDLLRIDAQGRMETARFDDSKLWQQRYWSPWYFECAGTAARSPEKEYIEQLKVVASSLGYEPGIIEILLEEGWTTDEIEDALYCYKPV